MQTPSLHRETHSSGTRDPRKRKVQHFQNRPHIPCRLAAVRPSLVYPDEFAILLLHTGLSQSHHNGGQHRRFKQLRIPQVHQPQQLEMFSQPRTHRSAGLDRKKSVRRQKPQDAPLPQRQRHASHKGVVQVHAPGKTETCCQLLSHRRPEHLRPYVRGIRNHKVELLLPFLASTRPHPKTQIHLLLSPVLGYCQKKVRTMNLHRRHSALRQ